MKKERNVKRVFEGVWRHEYILVLCWGWGVYCGLWFDYL